MSEVFQVTFASADSYNSVRSPAIAVFADYASAVAFVDAQPGYGLSIDWFIHPVPFNPPATYMPR